MTVIAADVGGSKTWLGWFPDAASSSSTTFFDNHAFHDFAPVLAAFLAQHPAIDPAHTTLSVAIAGPVQAHAHCRMTNLPWVIDAAALQHQFGFARVLLLNDLEATAFAMPGPAMTAHLLPLNGSVVDFRHPVAVLSVGTGLGEALLLPEGDGGFRVVPAEGGHKSLAPFDSQSASLVYAAFAAGRTSLSWEEWFSGSGLPELYQALFPQDLPLSSADITRQAQAHPLSHGAQCIEFMVQGLFAEAGNMALQYWSEGGVILAGGVAQHIAPWLQQTALQETFSRKSQHVDWLQRVPLALCTSTQAALMGALAFGRRQQMRGS